MIVKDLIELLQKQDGNREVVLHEWNRISNESKFIPLMLAATPNANTTNLLVLVQGYSYIEPIREE